LTARQDPTPNASDVDNMMAALPSKASVLPGQLRRVLVFAHADEFVHSSIPLAAATVEALGKRTSAFSTTLSDDPADFTLPNLRRFDAVFLASTTGHFLDDPNDPAATEARRAALLEYVRGGRGLAGIHAASDAYHSPNKRPWPEFNRMIGAIFDSHPWQHVWVAVDDPRSPITAMYRDHPFEMTDETYTFTNPVFSRDNVHVLLHIDVSKMSADDRAKENRPDHDYALSWIRKEGNGRVFYTAHGHREQVYSHALFLEHLLAGLQYAIGDLKADDRPSVLVRR
jgi:uncharacterized protein